MKLKKKTYWGNIYHENTNQNRQKLNQELLFPFNTTLKSSYENLVCLVLFLVLISTLIKTCSEKMI